MFSGIVEATSRVVKLEDTKGQRVAWIARPRGWKLKAGESVSVDGVCSTVQEVNRGTFRVIYMFETLRRTTLGRMSSGCTLNLERSLTLNSLIGGHLVQGHVDSTARIVGVHSDGAASVYEFSLPERFARYLVEKGSVAVDGISLTVIETRRPGFSVSLLDYTLQHTTLGAKGRGDSVNVEVDLLAKYVEKLFPS